jgi:hypothetical protein
MPMRFNSIAGLWLVLMAILTVAHSATAQDIFVTPISGVPFSGVIEVERSIVEANGAPTRVKTTRVVGRDSQGRIHNELRTLIPLASMDTPQIVRVHLYDPQTRVSAMFDPARRVFWTRTVNHPPATVPPALLASPTGNTTPQNEFTKEEDLGVHEVNGFLAHGVREIQTIPSTNDDNGKGIVVTDEYWYSEELRINLMVKHNDPRSGTATLRVTHLSRTEPDPALFRVPEGYAPGGTADRSEQ